MYIIIHMVYTYGASNLLKFQALRHWKMSAVTVPTCFESNLALGDGSTGADLAEVLKLTSNKVPNLYWSADDQFTYSFQVGI